MGVGGSGDDGSAPAGVAHGEGWSPVATKGASSLGLIY